MRKYDAGSPFIAWLTKSVYIANVVLYFVSDIVLYLMLVILDCTVSYLVPHFFLVSTDSEAISKRFMSRLYIWG